MSAVRVESIHLCWLGEPVLAWLKWQHEWWLCLFFCFNECASLRKVIVFGVCSVLYQHFSLLYHCMSLWFDNQIKVSLLHTYFTHWPGCCSAFCQHSKNQCSAVGGSFIHLWYICNACDITRRKLIVAQINLYLLLPQKFPKVIDLAVSHHPGRGGVYL